MDSDIEKIAKKFDIGIEKKVYGSIVEFLRNHFTTLKIEPTRPLLFEFTFFFEAAKPVIGFSGSEADIVVFYSQEELKIEKDDLILRKAGQYSFQRESIVYPCVIIQVITKTNTGKLQQENMKAQAWRKLFPRALLVLLAGAKRDVFDIRFDRDTTAFDEVISDLRDPQRCRVGMKRLRDVIETHIRTKWSGNDGFFTAL